MTAPTSESVTGHLLRDVFDPAHWPDVEPDTHLIQGLLSTSLSVLAAEPAVGKTHLAVAMAAALLNGEPSFLGCSITRSLSSVTFVCTDADGAGSVRRRLAPLVAVPAPGRVLVLDYPTRQGHTWQDVVDIVAGTGPGLLVVDNVLGVVGDVNDAGEARKVTAPLVQLTRSGTAVLMLTHAQKPGPKGPAQGVNAAIGSRYWTVPARSKATMTTRHSDGRRQLTVTNNDGEQVRIDARLDVVGGAPIWSSWTSGPASADGATRSSGIDWQALADRVVTEQPDGVTSVRGLGQHYADQVGRSAETVREQLSKLVIYSDGEWQRH